MYFLRLAKLKPAAEQIALEAWDGFSVWNRTSGDDRPVLADDG